MTRTPTKIPKREAIQWVFRTSQSNVPIVGLPSLSALGNKNNLRQEAIPTSLNAAPRAARKGKHSSTETVATVMGMIAMATSLDAKCFPQYALSVGVKLKYRSSPERADQYIAVIATVKSESVDNAGLTWRIYTGRGYLACVCLSNGMGLYSRSRWSPAISYIRRAKTLRAYSLFKEEE